MKSKFDYHVSLADALRSKDLRHLRDFAICILDMEDDEVNHLELEPLVAKIVGRFHEDVFAAATYDLLMTDFAFENFFIGMIEDGPTRIAKNDQETIETLKQIPFVDVREIPCGRGHAVFAAMADEVREAIKADHHRYEDLRCLKDDLDVYANSAAVLYGVVSLTEICELYRRWNPDTRVTEKIARLVLDFTQIYEESEFFLCEDKVCNLEFNADEGKDEIIADFIAERDTRPRWYPEREEDFMGFCEESALLETDEAHALDEFLEKHGVPDLQKRTDLLYEIIEKHQFEERISSIISFVAESCKLKDKDAGNGLIGVLVPFLNTTHLRILNGWTPDALHESFITPAVSAKPLPALTASCPRCRAGRCVCSPAYSRSS